MKPLEHQGKLFRLFISLAMLLIAFAALDDITTGSQESFWGEYLFLGCAGVWFGFLALRKLRPAW